MVDFPPGRRGHPPCPEGRILCQRHCSNSASIPSGWHGGSPENGPSYAGTWDPWLVCGASLHLQSPCVQVCSFLKNNIYIYSSIYNIYILQYKYFMKSTFSLSQFVLERTNMASSKRCGRSWPCWADPE